MTRSVLLVTPVWARDGGVGAHVQLSAAALARAGVDVHVLVTRDDLREPVPGVTIHVSRGLFQTQLDPTDRIGSALARDFSVIHTHQFDDPAVTARLQRVAPLVSSVHGFSMCTSGVHYFRPGQECQRAHGPGCVPNLLARGCAHTRDPRWLPQSYRRASRSRVSLQRSDLAISYSHAIDRHMAQNGVDRRAIVPYFCTVRPELGSQPDGRRRVVFAGRLVRAKGVDVLVKSARDVDAHFVICGNGMHVGALRRLASRVKVQDRITFAGWLSPSELAHELAEASVVAVPSLWPEPFGLVGIDAMAAGRPVVASATGGIDEWLQDGHTGVLVPPGDVRALADALSELLADPERQNAMGAAGRLSVSERFTEERHLAMLLEAYATARRGWEQRAGRR